MLEQLLKFFERITVALESIALSLKNAQVETTPKPATPAPAKAPAAPAAAPAPAAPVAPAPPAAVTPAALPGVDDGLGLDDPPPAKEPTEEDVLVAGRAASNNPAKGRAFVKAKLNLLKVDSVKEIKPEDRAKFIASLLETA